MNDAIQWEKAVGIRCPDEHQALKGLCRSRSVCLKLLESSSTRHVLSGHSLLYLSTFCSLNLSWWTIRKTYLQFKRCRPCPRLWITAIGASLEWEKRWHLKKESSSEAKSLENLSKNEKHSPKPKLYPVQALANLTNRMPLRTRWNFSRNCN